MTKAQKAAAAEAGAEVASQQAAAASQQVVAAERQPVDETTLKNARSKCKDTIYNKWVFTFKPTDPDVLRCLNESAVTSSEEITLFRGRDEGWIPQEERVQQKIERGWWFATTSNIMAALFHAHRGSATKYTNKSVINRTGPVSNRNLPPNMCCLYIIHLQPGTPYVDINSILGERQIFFYEYEIIVSPKGSFFQDSAMTIPGFRKLTLEDKLTGPFQTRIAENMKKNTFEFPWLYNPERGRRTHKQLKYTQDNLNKSIQPQIMKLLESPKFDIFEAWYGIPEVGSAGALANDAITAAEARAAAAAASTAMAEFEEVKAVFEAGEAEETIVQKEMNRCRQALEDAKRVGTTQEVETADAALKAAIAVYNEVKKRNRAMYYKYITMGSSTDMLVKAAKATAAVAAITAERVQQDQGAAAAGGGGAAAGGGGGYRGGARSRKIRRGRSRKSSRGRSSKRRS